MPDEETGHRAAGERSTKQAIPPPADAPTWRPFVAPEHLEEVSSTNTLLRDAALGGAPEGTVLLAERQSAGRGRLGRRWLDHPGGSVLCSILFRPRWPAERWHLAPLTVAMAALDAVAAVTGVTCSCKWPNDLLAPCGRKVAGILTEAVRGPEPGAVVGIGINCNWPAVFPEEGDSEAAVIAERAVSLDRVAGSPVDRDAVAAAMLAGIARRWPELRPGDGQPAALAQEGLLAEYRRRCSTLGMEVSVELASERVSGTAVGVDELGRLLVETAGGIRLVAAGDVVHLRPGGPLGAG